MPHSLSSSIPILGARYCEGACGPNFLEFFLASRHPARGWTRIQGGEDKAGRNAVAVIGYGLWQQLFAGERGVLGSTIRVNGMPLIIVGVAPLSTQSYSILDGHVLGFTLGVPILSGLLLGVLPSLHAGRYTRSACVVRALPAGRG